MVKLAWILLFISAFALLPTLEAQNCTITKHIDLAIIFDGSESMGKGPNLQLIKDYMARIVKLFDVQSDPNLGTRVAVWGYTVQPHLQFPFDQCKSKQHALDAIKRIRDLGSSGVFIMDMFRFLATDVYKAKQGAREGDDNVTKVAVLILDSPLLFSPVPPANIKAMLQNQKIETYAVFLEDEGAKSTLIDPFLPSPHSPAFTVPSKAALSTNNGLHEALKLRYGCSRCHPNPCRNSGKCKEKTTAPLYECECIKGWKGDNCTIEEPKNSCSFDPCNGYPCVQISQTVHKCTCPAACANSADCSACKKISPCSKNPCFSTCECRDSPSHQGGFVCYRSDGKLDRTCNMSKTDITCGVDSIEVGIPGGIVAEYEAGVPGAKVYLSPVSKNLHNCLATYDASQGKHVIKVPAPFSTCGTQKKTLNDGSREYKNQVWMNRASATIDMPVPVIQFKCFYRASQTLVSPAIRPTIGSNAPVVTSLGSFNVTLDAYRQPPWIPESKRGKLTTGSVYTISEPMYLTATLRSSPTTSSMVSQLAVKMINCFATSSPNTQTGKLNLVINGCPVTSAGVQMIDNAVGHSATIRFLTFKMASPYVYYSCRVDVCEKSSPQCRPSSNCPSGKRKKRDVDEQKNTLAFGPLIVLTEEEKERLLGWLDDVIPGDVNEELVDLTVKDPETSKVDFLTNNLPLIVVSIANFFVLLLFALFALCFYIRQSFMDDASAK